MADDTPGDDAAAPATRRRRARGEAAAAPKTSRAKRPATADTEPKPARKPRAARKESALAHAEQQVVKAVKPRARKVASTVRSGAKQAAKPTNRKRIIVGAAAAVAGIAAGIAATMNRRKIAEVSGDLAQSAKEKAIEARDKVEAIAAGADTAGTDTPPLAKD